MARMNNNDKKKATTKTTVKRGTMDKTTKKTDEGKTGALTTARRTPITKRTYDLETKRKGSKKGYYVEDANGKKKYYKDQKTTYQYTKKKPSALKGQKSGQTRKRY